MTTRPQSTNRLTGQVNYIKGTNYSDLNLKTINNESLLGTGNIELATHEYVNNAIKVAIGEVLNGEF